MANALTTRFEAPSWCSDRPYTSWTVFPTNTLTYYVQDLLSMGEGQNSACYPPNFYTMHLEPSIPIYSPGVCPQGYFVMSENANAGQHTSVCCPSSAANWQEGIGCQSVITEATVVKRYGTAVTITTGVAAESPIRVQWASSDLDLFTPVSAPIRPLAFSSSKPASPTTYKSVTRSKSSTTSHLSSTTSNSLPTSPVPNTTSNSLPTSPVPNTTSMVSSTSYQATSGARPANSLSTGAEVGIGIGVTAGVLSFAALGVLILAGRKRYQRRVQSADITRGFNSPYPYPYLETPKHEQQERYELQAFIQQQEIYEADAT